MASEEEEPVTSPDQHKPGMAKGARIGIVVVAAMLLVLNFGNQQSHTENIWLTGFALGLLGILAVDIWLRRTGIRR